MGPWEIASQQIDERQDGNLPFHPCLDPLCLLSTPSAPTLSRAGYFLAKVEGGTAGEPNAPIFFPAQPSSSLSLTRVADVTAWVLKHNHPRMSALSGHNFRQLGMLGKVLTI
jgi:hypothetical protein